MRNKPLLFLIFFANAAYGQQLVKDINTQGASQFSRVCKPCGDKVYFPGYDIAHGQELWATNGSINGSTALVKDISAGGGSGVQDDPQFTCLNNKIYFRTSTGIGRSDGTEAGTISVVDGLTFNSLTSNLTAFKNAVTYVVNGVDLMMTTGSQGSALIKTFTPPAGQFTNISTLASDDFLFINVVRIQQNISTIVGYDLWVYDGTNTTLLKTYTVGELKMYTTFGNRLIYSAGDIDNGVEFWVSDGSTGGTRILFEVDPGMNGCMPNTAVSAGNKILLSTTYPTYATWKSDGTTEGTTKILDDFSVDETIAANNKVYSLGTKGDGTFAIKRMDILLNEEVSTPLPVNFGEPHLMGVGNHTVLFSGDLGGQIGNEVYSFNDATAQVALIKDIYEGEKSSYPIQGVTLGDNVVFYANDGVHGYELWTSNGTAPGTILLKDVASNTLNANIDNIYRYEDKLYFLAHSTEEGMFNKKLWMSDGTDAGTHTVNDNIYSTVFAAVNNHVISFKYPDSVFIATNLLSQTSEQVGDFRTDLINTAYSAKTVSVGDDVYFYFNDSRALKGNELWKANVIADEVGMVKDINPGIGSSDVYQGVMGAALDDKLIFSANSGADIEPWVTDGTDAGTFRLKDIHPSGSSNPSYFTTLGDHVLFMTNTPSGGNELWATDGTIGGTVSLKQTGGAPLQPLGIIGERALFSVISSAEGPDLWVTDGTAEGTELLASIPVSGAYITHFMNAANKVYFVADYTLWVTDGTTQGTKKIVSPFNSFSVYNHAVSGDMLIMYTNGYLYTSLGTPETTKFFVQATPSSDMFIIGNKLIFVQGSQEYGDELFSVDLPGYADQTISVSGFDNIKYGKDYTVTMTASSGLTVTAESSDPSIAEIDGDKLILHKIGDVTFTVSQSGSGTYRPASIQVNVTIGPGDETISWTNESPRKFEDQSFVLDATSSADEPIVYTADDATVGKVTIDNDVATIVSPGKVRITASQGPRLYYAAAEPAVVNFCINPPVPTVTKTGERENITLTSSAENNVWTLNSEPLEGTGKSISAGNNGNYQAAAVVDGCVSDPSISISVITGLEDQDDVLEFYPNPAEKTLFISVRSPMQVKITDVNGRECYNAFVSENESIDVSSFSAGMYVIILNYKQYKFIKRY